MFRVGVIAGDGVGPEVTAEALETLVAAAPGAFELIPLPYSAEHTLATGETISDQAIAAIARDFDAVFLGALGDPRIPDGRHARDVLLGMRQKLDLYVNFRPARLLDVRHCPLKRVVAVDEIDLVVFRENTEELYAGIGGSLRAGHPEEVATDLMIATGQATERIIRRAFEYARERVRKKVCLVTKSNAVPSVWGLWERVFKRVSADYPEVANERLYADVAALELVRNPGRFDVLVTSNLLGDILSDLAAQLVGGLGLAPSGNLRPGGGPKPFGLFEPVHGSAPDIAGRGIANPVAAILSAALMARFLGLEGPATQIERAVARALAAGYTTVDLGGGLSTSEAGRAVRQALP